MPGGRRPKDSPVKVEQRRLLFIQTGKQQPVGQGNWDPKPEPFTEAVMALIENGAAVMFSASSGGRVIGVRIFEGDTPGERMWISDNEELDDWAQEIIGLAKAARSSE